MNIPPDELFQYYFVIHYSSHKPPCHLGSLSGFIKMVCITEECIFVSEFQMACSYNPRDMWLLVQLLNRSPPTQTKCNYAHLCSRT